MTRHPLLFGPGPVTVSQGVADVMGQPVMSDCDGEFVRLYKETLELLKEGFKTDGHTFLLPGTACAGIEAVLGSMFPPASHVLVVSNGFFGERLCEIAAGIGLVVSTTRAAWGRAASGELVIEALDRMDRVEGVIAVHHETSTGVLNPIREIGQCARERGAAFVVDAVSSFGGEELLMDAWGIAACIGSANKCVGASAGVVPIAVSRSCLKEILQKQTPPRCWYLNLRVWHDYMEKWWDWHPAPVTIPTSNVLALRVALNELLKEGLDVRHDTFKELNGMTRERLGQAGLQLLASEAEMANTLVAAFPPEGEGAAELIQFLRDRIGVIVGAGLGELSGKIIRIGLTSELVAPGSLVRILDTIEAWCEAKGVDGSRGEPM